MEEQILLLLLSKDVNVCEVSKVLVKHKIKARIDGDTIYLDGTISDELLDQLADLVTVIGVQNYTAETNFINYSYDKSKHAPMLIAKKETVVSVKEATVEPSCEKQENVTVEPMTIPSRAPEQASNIKKVKRGQIYRCDLGPMFGSEQGGVRPVIVIQNDTGNKYSPTTIVIPFTTQPKARYIPTHFRFKFTEENMVDYTPALPGLSSGFNTALAEQIQTVDKSRFIQYLGTMADSFMDELASFICASLSLATKEEKKETQVVKVETKPEAKPKVTPTVKPQVAPKYLPKKPPVSTPLPKKKKKSTFRRDPDYDPMEKQISRIKVEPPKPVPVRQSVEELNEVQRELLKFANAKDVYSICSNAMSDQEKVNMLLEMFGFDASRRGVDFLNQSIFASLRCQYYNLETLSNLVNKNNPGVPPAEIQRLIVARVKENFKMKKAPTSDFIRLINNLIKTKGELVND